MLVDKILSSLSTAAQAAAPVAGGLFGFLGARKSAKTQKEIAEMNIAEQQRAMNQQRKESLEDRSHDEMYNSPLMERARLEAAGLSPQEYVGQTTPTSSEGLVPDYAAAPRSGQSALVSAAALGANSPMLLMQGALSAAKDIAQIHKDNSAAAEMSGSKAVLDENARFLKETFQDRALQVRLENDKLFTETNESIRRGALLLEQKSLTATQRHHLEIEVSILQRTQEYRVSLEKSKSEKAKLDVQISEKELSEMMPAQLRKLESDIAANYARAAADNAQAKATATLLPLQFSHLEKANAALELAVKDSSLIHDENIVKHNVWMSHIAEFSDAIVSRYKVDRQTADWYAVSQVANLVQKAATTAVSIVGVGKMLAPAAPVAAAAAGRSPIIQPGSSTYERMARQTGLDMPGLAR